MKMNEIKFVPKANAFADVYSKATGMPFVGEMMVAAAGQGGDSPEPEPVEPTPLNEWVIPTEVINLLIAQSGGSQVYPSNPTIWEGEVVDLICGIDFTPVGCTKTITIDGESVGVRESAEIEAFDGFQFTAEVAALVQQETGLDISGYIGKYVVVFSNTGSGILPQTVSTQSFLTKDGVSYSTGTYTANWTLDDNEVE